MRASELQERKFYWLLGHEWQPDVWHFEFYRDNETFYNLISTTLDLRGKYFFLISKEPDLKSPYKTVQLKVLIGEVVGWIRVLPDAIFIQLSDPDGLDRLSGHEHQEPLLSPSSRSLLSSGPSDPEE